MARRGRHRQALRPGLRILLQRVSRAEVRVGGESVGRIGPGLVVLAGIGRDDDETVVRSMTAKILNLRIFRDDDGKTNRSLLDVGGEVLVVSQFTLFADTSRGRRPSFLDAADPADGERLYEVFAASVAAAGVKVAGGVFGAEMEVELVNDGPMTIWLEGS